MKASEVVATPDGPVTAVVVVNGPVKLLGYAARRWAGPVKIHGRAGNQVPTRILHGRRKERTEGCAHGRALRRAAGRGNRRRIARQVL